MSSLHLLHLSKVNINDFVASTEMASDEDGLLSPMSEEESPGLDLVVDLSTSSKPIDLSTFNNSGPVDMSTCHNQPRNPSSFAPVGSSRAARSPIPQSKSVIIGLLNQVVRTRKQLAKEISHVCYVSKEAPKNVKEALNHGEWFLAMQEELNQFVRNDVWYFVPRPTNTNVIGTKWIFKNKTDEQGNVARNKARLVAQGYTQIKGIYFDETFAPVARLESKALYDLKQAPRAWYERLSSHLLGNGYVRGSVDKTLFVKNFKRDVLIAQVYVDDIVVFKSNNTMMGSLFLNPNMQKNLVKKFGLEAAKSARTPMSTSTKIHRDLHGKSVNQTLYKSMIGSLLYLTASRPGISYSVGVCARFQSDPKESHLFAVKRIIKYVSGTIDFGLWYTYDTSVNLVGYSDADWAGCSDDRKSTSGGVLYVGNNVVAWHSKKQNFVSLSTTEAEYVAVGSCYTQLL
ncbi:unnamed protein product [Prunus armeniaca]